MAMATGSECTVDECCVRALTGDNQGGQCFSAETSCNQGRQTGGKEQFSNVAGEAVRFCGGCWPCFLRERGRCNWWPRLWELVSTRGSWHLLTIFCCVKDGIPNSPCSSDAWPGFGAKGIRKQIFSLKGTFGGLKSIPSNNQRTVRRVSFSNQDSSFNQLMTRWWFQTFFIFHPYLGKIPILTNIFQMGWNHRPDDDIWGKKQ